MQVLLWLKMLLKGLDIQVGTVPVYEDNEACIALANLQEGLAIFKSLTIGSESIWRRKR
jgi:hypothetical protein